MRDQADPYPNSSAPAPLSAWFLRWRIRLMLTLTAMLFVGSAATTYEKFASGPGVRDPLPLQNVHTASAMLDELTKQNGSWPSPNGAIGPGQETFDLSVNLLPVRWAFFWDSVLVVPAYTGWFLLGLIFLYLQRDRENSSPRRVGRLEWHELALHLMCVVPVAGALFDWSENGITMRAIEDPVSYVLADDTVLDMHRASLWKWRCFTLSCALLSVNAASMFLVRFGRLLQVHDGLREAVSRIGAYGWLLLASAASGIVAATAISIEPRTAASILLGLTAFLAQIASLSALMTRDDSGMASGESTRSAVSDG